MKERRWYQRIPHPVVMLFGMIVLATILSYILPAGSYERELISGRQRVIPGSYSQIDSNPLSILDMFTAFSQGFRAASDIIFVVLSSGIMFGILDRTRVLEYAVGSLVRRLGVKNRSGIVVIMTYVFGMMGVAVGYENNIALIPIGAMLSLAIGGDLILAAGLSVAAITVGFGLSPINPYTVGIGHQIAEMPMFSGWLLRGLLCFAGLSILAFFNWRYLRRLIRDPDSSLGQGLDISHLHLKAPLDTYQMSRTHWAVLLVFLIGMTLMLYGIFEHGWYLQEISAIFLMISIMVGIVGRLSANAISTSTLEAVALVAPGAFMVGYATTIKIILEMGQISDTIAYYLSESLTDWPVYISALFMSLAQSTMNFMIPSGSGQALATLPIMIPAGELVGLTRQTSILAFQIGDGVTNLINPTLGGLIAMLSMCRVPFDRWLRFILPIMLCILAVAWTFLLIAVAIGWGPA